MEVDVVINFIHREEMVLAKTLGRRICPVCHKNFNIAHFETDDGYFLPPILPEGTDITVCDNIQAHPETKLVSRPDDTKEVVKRRLQVYNSQTLPILDFFRNKTDTIVIDFEAKKGIADFPVFYKMICEALLKKNWKIGPDHKM